MPTKQVLILGDLHFPFHCKKSLQVLLARLKDGGRALGFSEDRVDAIIQIGDLYDLWSFSRWGGSQNHIGMTPLQEVTEARIGAEEMWNIIHRYAPRAKKIQMQGNHDMRYKKQLETKIPELAGVISFDHMWVFPNVETSFDERNEFVLDGVCYMHGFRSKLGDHAKNNLMPTVCGHSHLGGHVFLSPTLWEGNVGYLADVKSKVMTYTRQSWVRWTRGYGLVDSKGFRFINLEVEACRNSKISLLKSEV